MYCNVLCYNQNHNLILLSLGLLIPTDAAHCHNSLSEVTAITLRCTFMDINYLILSVEIFCRDVKNNTVQKTFLATQWCVSYRNNHSEYRTTDAVSECDGLLRRPL